MALDGYTSIHSLDYSPVVIARLEAARAAAPPGPLRDALSFGVADMRRLEGIETGQFGGALDKGALDALLCGDCGEADAAAALGEVQRPALGRGARGRGAARAAVGWRLHRAAVGHGSTPPPPTRRRTPPPPNAARRSGACWRRGRATSW
jgi:hypothetical protein